MFLWFENSRGERRVICDCTTWEEVNRSIDEFIAKCNSNKHNAAKERYGKDYDPSKVIPFVRYYTRVWKEDNMTKIDVGSHTEFFYWEGKFVAMTPDKNGEAKFEYE